jgi:hypothetical protein
MSYSTKRAALIADQLERLATQNAHQLAGQVANLDFWISEAADALRVIDEYPARFRRLRDAQVAWVKAHGTKVFGYCPICGGACEFGPETPAPPVRIAAEDFAKARDALRRAAHRYLIRLYRARLLDAAAVRQACDVLGVGLEAEDLTGAPEPNGDSRPMPPDVLVPDPSRKR